MTARIFRDRYGTEWKGELDTLVEEYEELRALRHKAWIHVRLMDVEQAFRALRPKEKQAVLLCGFMNMSTHAAARLLGVSQNVVWKHYTRGMRSLATYLNGG